MYFHKSDDSIMWKRYGDMFNFIRILGYFSLTCLRDACLSGIMKGANYHRSSEYVSPTC